MSGEGGRWASNGSNNATIESNGGWLVGTVDQVYGDSAEGTEAIPYCHRSATAPMFTGSDVNHENLACSGAQTNSFVNPLGRAKPGVDFDTITGSDGRPVPGQASQLQKFAATHDVGVVTLSIGGNDLGFADIIATCLTDWVVGTTCSNSDFIAARINPAAKEIITARVYQAIENVNKAMTTAGYKPDQWRLMIQLPPSPVPPAALASYPDVGFSRQILGGCGMLDADLNFANDTLLPFLDSTIVAAADKAAKSSGNAPITTVDMKEALVGHRLCEEGTTRPDAGTGIPPNGFSQNTEWVRFISVLAAEGYAESSEAQEAVHPTYFGQRTLSACMRAALSQPSSTQEVFCTRDDVLSFNEDAQPAVTVTPAKLPY